MENLFNDLREAIKETIIENKSGAITAQKLQDLLLKIVDNTDTLLNELGNEDERLATSITSETGRATGEENAIRRDFAVADTTALQAAKEYADGKNAELKAELTSVVGNKLIEAKKYADQLVTEIINGSPEALDTLQELAAALGNDPNFAATIATEIGKKVDKVAGKQLSDENFTAAEKQKLSTISNGANNYVLPQASSTVLGGVKSATTGTTANRDYKVQVIEDDTMKVNVPWTDTDTKVTSAANHYTPSTENYTPTAGSAVSFGGTVVTGISKDNKGHITGVTTGAIPANPNTDTKVTSVDNHYSPTAASGSELTSSAASTGNYAINTEYSVVTGVKIQRDNKGHVTGVTTTNQKIKDTDTKTTVENSLTSTSTTNALSAAQGKALNEKFGSYVKEDDAWIAKKYTLNLTSLSTSNFYPVTFGNSSDELDCQIASQGGQASDPYNCNHIHFLLRANGWSDTPKSFVVLAQGNYTNDEITIGAIGYGQNQGEKCVWLRGGKNYYVRSTLPPTLRTSNYTYSDEIYTVGTNLYGGTNTKVTICWQNNADRDNSTVALNSKFSGYLTTSGTASKASQLATARTISLVGDVAGSASFNGTKDINIVAKDPYGSIRNYLEDSSFTLQAFTVEQAFINDPITRGYRLGAYPGSQDCLLTFKAWASANNSPLYICDTNGNYLNSSSIMINYDAGKIYTLAIPAAKAANLTGIVFKSLMNTFTLYVDWITLTTINAVASLPDGYPSRPIPGTPLIYKYYNQSSYVSFPPIGIVANASSMTVTSIYCENASLISGSDVHKQYKTFSNIIWDIFTSAGVMPGAGLNILLNMSDGEFMKMTSFDVDSGDGVSLYFTSKNGKRYGVIPTGNLVTVREIK